MPDSDARDTVFERMLLAAGRAEADELGVPDAVKFDSAGYLVSTQVASGQVLRIDPRSGDKTALAQTGSALKVKLDRVSGERDRLGQTHRALLVQHKDLQGAERSLTDQVEVLSAEKTTLRMLNLPVFPGRQASLPIGRLK